MPRGQDRLWRDGQCRPATLIVVVIQTAHRDALPVALQLALDVAVLTAAIRLDCEHRCRPREGAAGYAVFSNLGVKILVAGSGNGKGIAVDNKSKKETFMKMLELQAGLGMGVKKFRVIFVFDTEKTFNSFVNSGWQFGGQATAAAKNADQGQRGGEWCRFRMESGCISSRTRASPSKSPLRAPSTTRTMI